VTRTLFSRGAALLVLPGLAALVAGFQAPKAAAQAPAALDVVQVAPRVHMIAGDGGNIVVQTGPEGTIVVDTGAGQRSREVLAAIEAIASTPIRYVLNTSASRDRVGGNAPISAAGQALAAGGGAGGGPNINVVAGVRTGAGRVAHENVLLRMSGQVNGMPRFPEAAWPTEGFIDRKEMYLNGEAIQMLHQPAAHSNGDSLVVFRSSDVVVTGDIINVDRFPVIDLEAGGSIQGLIDALNRIVEIAVPPQPLVWQPGGTQVIPGSGRVLEEADVVEYRDMVTIVRDVIAEEIKKGQTLDQIQASQPTRGYTTRYGADSGPWTTRMFVEAIYTSLTKGGTR
jgi:glyoxylase-like metal-dependent hydrolase (beta-lactamase superfamily II)